MDPSSVGSGRSTGRAAVYPMEEIQTGFIVKLLFFLVTTNYGESKFPLTLSQDMDLLPRGYCWVCDCNRDPTASPVLAPSVICYKCSLGTSLNRLCITRTSSEDSSRIVFYTF